jgi:hypothetical protein
MNSAERLEDLLRRMRETSSSLRAPDAVEERLLLAYRAQHVQRAPVRYTPWRWIAATAAAAAVLALVFAVRLSRLPDVDPLPDVARVHAPAPPSHLVKSQSTAPAVSVPRPKPSLLTAARPKEVKGSPARSQEDTAEFIALPYAPPLSVYDHGQVVRVRLPRTSVGNFGLPVNEERLAERIPADVLLGQDGIPRAIRFVSAGR